MLRKSNSSFLYTLLLNTIAMVIFMNSVSGQECVGGQIHTNEAFLYGRFETAMRSAEGEGVVSSFFLYNLDVGCNWPDENNELDIEMTGNSEDLFFSTHYPGPWYYTDTYTPDFNPHDSIHHYAFEWEPGIVRWFVDGELVVTQDQDFVEGLIYPMKIVMNLWAAVATGWVGVWDPSIMPVQSEYEYVRYYEYDTIAGNTGTNNNYSLVWDDEFTSFDADRWNIEEWGGFGGNYCTFKESSVEISNGKLYLKIEEEIADPESVEVTFSVDANNEDFLMSDNVFLNGNFNEWCGNCEPMLEDNGVWSISLDLVPGKYEYVFTKNFWEENGSPPLGSACDYIPCDEWANYGFVVSAGDEAIVLDTYCWGECTSCLALGIEENNSILDKKLIGIYDLSGRKVLFRKGELQFYYYSDGSVEKRIIY